VRGSATAEQAGLIRCYTRALAHHDLPALRELVDPDPVRKITSAQLAHSADARAGLATATFSPNPSDNAYVTVAISYADGVSETFPVELANPASAHSWRIAIGPFASADPNIPPASP